MQNPLKALIENLRDGRAIKLGDYQDIYQSWTIKKLRDILKAEFFQSDEIMKLAQNYWLLNFDEGASETLKRAPNEIAKADCRAFSKEDLERLHVLQKLAQILHPVLKKYWDRKRILNPELQVILEDGKNYPWQAIINSQIPESQETEMNPKWQRSQRRSQTAP